MKYYRLKRDLPTFEKGELFYMDDFGSIHRAKDRNIHDRTAGIYLHGNSEMAVLA